MPVKGRPRLVSHQANTTKLFVDDRREVIALSTGEKKCVSDVIRELVHEALRTRRFRAFGRDEGDEFIRNLYRETIAECVKPLLRELVAVRQMIERFSTGVAEELQPIIVKTAQNEQAILEITTQVLSQVMISQHIGKVLATIAMQKDNLTPDQVKSQLATHHQVGALQARSITDKILTLYALPELTTDANKNGENAI